MRVKLKAKEDLEKLGFKLLKVDHPGYPTHVSLVKGEKQECIGMSIDLMKSQDLIVTPKNSIDEETYALFKDAFEVIQEN